MVEESTAASHSLAKEANSLAELLAQFKLGAVTAARPAAATAPAARAEDPRSTRERIAKAVKSFPTSGNAAVKTDEWEEF